MSYLNKDDRRAAIVQAAVALITREGFEAATVRAVAREMGASPGQIHHHFSSADALRAEALGAVWSRMFEELRDRMPATSTRDRCALLLGAEGHPADDISERLWRDALAASHMHSRVREALVGSISVWRGMMTELLRNGQSEGDVPRELDIEDAADQLLAMAFGMVSLRGLSMLERDKAQRALLGLYDRLVGAPRE